MVKYESKRLKNIQTLLDRIFVVEVLHNSFHVFYV